jgi:predicted transcriptional regulator
MIKIAQTIIDDTKNAFRKYIPTTLVEKKNVYSTD